MVKLGVHNITADEEETKIFVALAKEIHVHPGEVSCCILSIYKAPEAAFKEIHVHSGDFSCCILTIRLRKQLSRRSMFIQVSLAAVSSL